MRIAVPMAGFINKEAELARLNKEIGTSWTTIEIKLANEALLQSPTGSDWKRTYQNGEYAEG